MGMLLPRSRNWMEFVNVLALHVHKRGMFFEKQQSEKQVHFSGAKTYLTMPVTDRFLTTLPLGHLQFAALGDHREIRTSERT